MCSVKYAKIGTDKQRGHEQAQCVDTVEKVYEVNRCDWGLYVYKIYKKKMNNKKVDIRFQLTKINSTFREWRIVGETIMFNITFVVKIVAENLDLES